MSVRRLGFIRLKLLMLRVYLLYLHTVIEGDEGKENTKPKSYDPVPSTRTEQPASFTTFFDTLPRKSRPSADRPSVPTTIKSAPQSSAFLITADAGESAPASARTSHVVYTRAVVLHFNRDLSVAARMSAKSDASTARCVLDCVFDDGADGAAQGVAISENEGQVRCCFNGEFMVTLGSFDALDLFARPHNFFRIHTL